VPECRDQILAIEYAKRGIRVNAVHRHLKTPMYPVEAYAQLGALHRRPSGEISDIVDAILYLEGPAL